MNDMDLLFTFTDYEWTLYSIYRLISIQNYPQYIKNEFIKQIFLEYEFRGTVDDIIKQILLEYEFTGTIDETIETIDTF